VTVGQGTAPTAAFAFSPDAPHPGDTVHFNASASTAASGRRLVSYVWDFGNGSAGTGVQTSQKYLSPRAYTVTLTVTDDIGRTATVSRTITVEIPDDDDGGSPQP
jgi:PKD repeat protein